MPSNNSYDASDIEVLEGLEPVRKRPGMYIGGTDKNGMHHLFSEIIDNSMDEAVAGHANKINVEILENNIISVSDNGRGIPVDKHPKFPSKSALEVILTTLHAGGKFNNKIYQTSGGLHGVGISVVNALSEFLNVEVYRDKNIYSQDFKKGKPQGKLLKLDQKTNKRGTKVTFKPDENIFDKNINFNIKRLYEFCKSKAYLFAGTEIKWVCDNKLALDNNIPNSEVFNFSNGLEDYLNNEVEPSSFIGKECFSGKKEKDDNNNSVVNSDPEVNSSYSSLESNLGADGDNNFVQAVAGGLPTNISEPTTDESDSFILADVGNIGNGNRYFDVVDRSELSDVYLKFEIQAEYGISDNGSVNNSFEANKSENPSLYIWEVASDGETLVDSLVVYVEDLSSSTSISAELDLPGVYSTDNNLSLTYPVYIVEDMPIAFSDEQGADENWTDLIYGTRFKFDNSFFFYESTKDGALYIPPIRDAYTVESDPDSTLMTSLFISEERKTEISYYSRDIFDMRPPYKYKIEFSNTPEFSVSDMVVPALPT